MSTAPLLVFAGPRPLQSLRIGNLVALAHSFLVIDPRVKHPNTEHWERAFQLFNLLL